MIGFLRSLVATADRIAAPTLATLARATFAATLAGYYWASARTKLDGVGLSLDAYVQIFPRAVEAAGYDLSKLTAWHSAVVAAGTLAEWLLPALLILGLATRPAALAMIGFVLVQTLTDLVGHGAAAQPETLGAWFDRVPDSLILDQRLLWITLLVVPLLHGAGPLSLDRLIARRMR